jgi:hypothetical protein
MSKFHSFATSTNIIFGNSCRALIASCALMFLTIIPISKGFSQITNLRFSNVSATYVPITGTNIVNPGTVIGAASAVTNIGFTFKFQGVDYTQFSANAAGLFKFGSVAVTTQTVNSAISTTNVPKLYAVWDAFFTGTSASGGGVSYLLSGTSPNRVLTVQWKVNTTSATTASATNFQIKLYETTNVIEYHYGASAAVPSASVGLGGLTADDYLSILPVSGAISNSVNFNDLNSGPVNGT